MINGKKIAIDARMIEMSGIGTYIQHIIDQDIYDIALGDENTIHKYNQHIKVIPFDAKIYSLSEQIKFPAKQLKEEGVSLIHFPHYNVPFFYRGKYVVTVHDLIHLVYPQYLKNGVARYYSKLLMSHAIKGAAHLFTVSEYSKKDIIKFFKVPEKKISITYNAVDGKFQHKESDEVNYLREKYGIGDKKVLLYVGNLKPHKNLKILLEAYKELPERDQYIVLLVGKAFQGVHLNENGIEERGVIVTGPVSSEELIDLYNLADIFVFPSLYEGFGIPPLEAMACGTPVICSNASSLPEVVGDAALMFEPRNNTELESLIKQIDDDSKLKDKLIKNGYSQVAKFSWEKSVSAIKQELVRIVR